MIARAFARDLRTSRTGELLAVASRDEARAAGFGAPRAYASYDALLDDPDVEAVYVATPHPLHAPWAIRAAGAGKHVLCEKPLTVDATEAEAVVDAARRHDVFLMEAFMYRCHPRTARFLSRVRAGEVGEVRGVEAVHCFDGRDRLTPDNRLLDPALGGGAILDVGCYCVSGALLVAGGAEPTMVVARGQIGDTGVDLRSDATVTFANGIVAELRCAIDREESPVLRVHGTDGTIALDDPWLPAGEDRGLYAYEADDVADAVAAGAREGTVSWAESLATMRVLDRWRAAL